MRFLSDIRQVLQHLFWMVTEMLCSLVHSLSIAQLW